MYELCPVCFWEYDPHKSADPATNKGANGISLVDARGTFLRIGAMSDAFLSEVRAPTANEIPD